MQPGRLSDCLMQLRRVDALFSQIWPRMLFVTPAHMSLICLDDDNRCDGVGWGGILAYWCSTQKAFFAKIIWNDGVKWHTGVLGQYRELLVGGNLFEMWRLGSVLAYNAQMHFHLRAEMAPFFHLSCLF